MKLCFIRWITKPTVITLNICLFFFSFHFVSNLLVDILFYGIYSVQATFSGIHISESAN